MMRVENGGCYSHFPMRLTYYGWLEARTSASSDKMPNRPHSMLVVKSPAF
jgi:hypothetical protein